MTDSLAIVTPAPMEGHGVYNRSSRVQAAGLSPAVPLLEAMYAALVDMVEEGFVRAEEARRMVIPTVGRSRSDLVAPFAESGSFTGLSIEQMEVFFSEDRIWADFEDGGEAREFGARWAAFSRASAFPTLAAGLEGGRADSRAITFLDRLEADVAARMAASPERMLIPLAKLLLVKAEPKSCLSPPANPSVNAPENTIAARI
jgi:hypothetical protein